MAPKRARITFGGSLPIKIAHIDTDVTGSASIQHLVESGHVQTFRAPRFKDAENILWGLDRGQITADLVMLDSVTGLLERLRQDVTLEPSKAKQTPIWDNRVTGKSTRDHYYMTGDLGKRLFAPLRELTIPSIFIAHERNTSGMNSRQDVLSYADKFMPNAQKEINSDLFAFADAIIRLYPYPTDFEWEGVNYPAGTRVLLLSATSDSAAGVRAVWGREVPPMMVVQHGDPYAFMRFVQAIGYMPHNTVLYGPPKIGKGGPSFSKILSPSGWKTLGELSVGDEIIGKNGRATIVTGVYDRGTLPVYRVTFTDGATALVDGDHLWAVQTGKQRKCSGNWQVKKTLELSKDWLVRPHSGGEKHGVEHRYSIPLVEPVQFDEVKMPLSPYVLGALIANGYCSHVPVLSLHKMDEDIAVRVITESKDAVRRPLETTGGVPYTAMKIAVRGSQEPLRQLNLYGVRSNQKFIPEQYLFGSIEQRIALLQGLLDCDGTVTPQGRPVYTTTSYQLALDLTALVQSLGGTARTSTQVRIAEGKPTEHHVSIMLPKGINPFFSCRKADKYRAHRNPIRSIVSIEPAGEADVRCISVAADDQLYVTEHYIVTHNTTFAAGAAYL